MRMITVGVIKNGERYLTRHLRKNDYWAEGEKEVQGEWIGHGAAALGLAGSVNATDFESLRANRHPRTGKRLTKASQKDRVAFFDIQLSAPKDVSVAAMVGGDERIRAAFYESVKTALGELEHFAAVRDRRGDANDNEVFRLTENFAGAAFLHDASRDLDPQLHVHAVLANATWDPQRNQWLALQPAEMMRASGYVRQVLYRELASKLRALGYDPYGMNSRGFSIRGIEHLRDRYSSRAKHVAELAREFEMQKGRRPTKKEIEVLVKSSRADKLTEVTTERVREQQRSKLSEADASALDGLVERAKAARSEKQVSHGLPRSVVDAALRHVFERKSVAREAEVLSAGLELHPEFFRWRELRGALAANAETIRRGGEMTLKSIHREETAAVKRARAGRSSRVALGAPEALPTGLTPGQQQAARALLRSTDAVLVLVGDAGTGKTSLLKAVQAAHVASGGAAFLPLAPTTRSRDALIEAGFESAVTVQSFLTNPSHRAPSSGSVILVDEAGLLSTRQIDAITATAEHFGSRLLLVGDTKQHYSVERGDGLRNLVTKAELSVIRLSEVLRQRAEDDRKFSRMLADGHALDALLFAERKGMLEEAGDNRVLFRNAAAHYAANVAAGLETLVVIPYWEEIERFNVEARRELRDRSILGKEEVLRDAVKPLAWTEEKKVHWDQYERGDQLLFTRNTRFYKRGSATTVESILSDGLVVIGDDGRERKITRKQRGAFDVGRRSQLPLSRGDRILIRSKDEDGGFNNGDVCSVSQVDADRDEVLLSNGRRLEKNFHAWTYAHAVTSYRSQGSTAEESIVVLGEVAERAITQREFYVGNTRFRGRHKIYVAHRDEIMSRIASRANARELSGEFIERRHISLAEEVALRPLSRLGRRARSLWLGFSDRVRKTQQTIDRKMEV